MYRLHLVYLSKYMLTICCGFLDEFGFLWDFWRLRLQTEHHFSRVHQYYYIHFVHILIMFLIENNSNFNFKASSLRNMISADSPRDIKSIRWGFSPDINNLHLCRFNMYVIVYEHKLY